MAIDPVDPLKATVANGVASTQKLIFDALLHRVESSIPSISLYLNVLAYTTRNRIQTGTYSTLVSSITSNFQR